MRGAMVTGWMLSSPWGPHPYSVVSPVRPDAEPTVSLTAALEAARERWGRLRVGRVDAWDDWPTESTEDAGVRLGFAGPDADARALQAARDLLDYDVADAVLLGSTRAGAAAGLLLERTADALIALVDAPARPDAVLSCPEQESEAALALPEAFECWVLGALVVGADVLASGVRLPGASVEPTCMSVAGSGVVVGLEARG